MKHLMKVTLNRHDGRFIHKIIWLTTVMIIKDNEYILVNNSDDESFTLSIDAIDVIMCHICVIV